MNNKSVAAGPLPLIVEALIYKNSRAYMYGIYKKLSGQKLLSTWSVYALHVQ